MKETSSTPKGPLCSGPFSAENPEAPGTACSPRPHGLCLDLPPQWCAPRGAREHPGQGPEPKACSGGVAESGEWGMGFPQEGCVCFGGSLWGRDSILGRQHQATSVGDPYP